YPANLIYPTAPASFSLAALAAKHAVAVKHRAHHRQWRQGMFFRTSSEQLLARKSKKATKPQRRVSLLVEALEDRTVPTLLGNQVFPADNPWNQRITTAPLAVNSA